MKTTKLWAVVGKKMYNPDYQELCASPRNFFVGFEQGDGEHPGQADIYFTKKLALFRAKLINETIPERHFQYIVVPVLVSDREKQRGKK